MNRDSVVQPYVLDLHAWVDQVQTRATASGPTDRGGPPARFALLDDEAWLAMPPMGVEDAFPMPMSQAGMLYEAMGAPGGPGLHVTCRAGPDSRPPSADALRRAAAALTQRHEILRASIDLTPPTGPLLRVHESVEVPIAYHDLSGISDDGRPGALTAFLGDQRQQRCDLSRPPLLRLHVHHGGERWWLTLVECPGLLDAASRERFIAELLGTYRAITKGSWAGPPPPPPVHLADLVALERDALNSAGTRAFWRDRCHRYARARVPSEWAGTDDTAPSWRREVSIRDALPGLGRLALAAGAPVPSVALAAHIRVLRTVTGLPRFHTGLICEVRPDVAGGREVLGMHLNTVPFAIDLDAAGRTWREMVCAVHDEEVRIGPHRRYPLARMQRDWGGGAALIDVAFGIGDGPDVFPLSVRLVDDERLVVTGRSDRVDRTAGERLADIYSLVFAAMAEDPDGDARAAHLPTAERRRVIELSHGPSPAERPVRLLHRLFEEQARRTPTAVAVAQPPAIAEVGPHCGAVEMTYAELDAEAERFATVLRGVGVGPEALVAVCLPRSAAFPIAALGVLKAGGAYLPLDMDHPDDRLLFTLADSGARILVTTEELRARFRGHFDGRILDAPEPGSRPDAADAADAADTPVAVSAENVAYVIYTSGSTGRPKGTAITHAGIAHFTQTFVKRVGAGAGDRVLQFLSPAFDACVCEIYSALATGATLVLPPRDAAGADLLRDPQLGLATATHILTTPSALERLSPDDAPALRFCALGGEKVTPELARRWAGRVRLLNIYGPTEITVACNMTEIPPPVPASVPIGRPVAGYRTYVLDAHQELLPIGVTGEMCVGGVGVARGYVGRPALTAERFIPDPVSGIAGARLYRTGDLVRLRADGQAEYLGRADGQVKIRGFRVELGEIEAALAEHPAVRVAAARMHVAPSGSKSLVGYLVPRHTGTEPSTDTAGLRRFLARRLPSYMVPTRYVTVTELPTAATGKLDRAALPAPTGPGAGHRPEYVAPRSPAERALATAFADALGLDRVGVLDDFFDLGGDSLAMMRVIGQVRRSDGIEVTFQDFFERPTVSGIASTVSTDLAP